MVWCMKTKCLLVLLFLFCALSPPLAAVTYSPRLEQSTWTVESSIFDCTLTHDIPYYGQAIFRHQAGEKQVFFLKADSPRMRSGRASLQAESPNWHPREPRQALGYVDVSQGHQPIRLEEATSKRLLSLLFEGMQPVFTRRSWYADNESVQVKLSTVNFRPAYQQFLGCVAKLLPVNYEQISRTAVYFQVGRDALRDSERQKLENIAIYAKADPDVISYVIDGHTDSTGDRGDNLLLSEQRAKAVADYLIAKGVPAAKVTVRWHGERYPVATNRSVSGRAKNRRVTIRLDKDQPGELNENAARLVSGTGTGGGATAANND